MVDPADSTLSVRQQCDLLGLPRASYYYRPAVESKANLEYMRLMDGIYMEHPTYGVEMMTAILRRGGYAVNPKRIRRLLRLMGLEAIYAKKSTSGPGEGHKIYPYLLRWMGIGHIDQVWSTDITYVPLRGGYMYLVAVMDWYSRYVLSWRLSNTLDVSFCLEALEDAFECGSQPAIFNTDQGSQFTSTVFTEQLLKREISVSMDGRGRALDNVFIERLWRTVKYDDIYLKDYETVQALWSGLRAFFLHYNHDRPHKSLGHHTPHEVYCLGYGLDR